MIHKSNKDKHTLKFDDFKKKNCVSLVVFSHFTHIMRVSSFQTFYWLSNGSSLSLSLYNNLIPSMEWMRTVCHIEFFILNFFYLLGGKGKKKIFFLRFSFQHFLLFRGKNNEKSDSIILLTRFSCFLRKLSGFSLNKFDSQISYFCYERAFPPRKGVKNFFSFCHRDKGLSLAEANYL